MTGLRYYEVLGVESSASDQDIKKSYRRLALRWHPDKNPHNKTESEKKFKEIAEAYEILSNKSKRSIYDRYGEDGLKSSASDGRPSSSSDFHGFGMDPFGHFSSQFRSPFDVFREFFGGRDPFQDFHPDLAGGGAQNGVPGFRSRIFDDFFDFPDPFDDLFTGPLQQRKRSAPFGFGGASIFSSFNTPQDSLVSGLPGVDSGGFFSTTSFSSTAPGSNAAVKRTTTSTRVVDGKTVVTVKTIENGVETVVVKEDGKTTSRTVDGVAQALAASAAAAPISATPHSAASKTVPGIETITIED